MKSMLSPPFMTLRGIGRKVLAVVALVALLTTSLDAIAKSLSTSEMACCTTAYCPVHHRQFRDVKKDVTDCGSRAKNTENDCSMRACDSTPAPTMEGAPFVLAPSISIFYQPIVVEVPESSPRFSPFAFGLPNTPPPRAFLS